MNIWTAIIICVICLTTFGALVFESKVKSDNVLACKQSAFQQKYTPEQIKDICG